MKRLSLSTATASKSSWTRKSSRDTKPPNKHKMSHRMETTIHPMRHPRPRGGLKIAATTEQRKESNDAAASTPPFSQHPLTAQGSDGNHFLSLSVDHAIPPYNPHL